MRNAIDTWPPLNDHWRALFGIDANFGAWPTRP